MKNAKSILNEQFDEMVTVLKKVISFNTEKGTESVGAPFGKNVKDCLDFVLKTAQSFGFSTYDCDGFAGHVDFTGAGDKVLGILGHLDVVPAKAEEWKYPPYAAEIHDGKMFGRGTMDDKGPMIACLFAAKALKDSGFIPQKTIRLIFGCDEESGMQCVEHYFSKMPFPDVSFSPDGDFPVINREKGIYQFNVVCGKLPNGVSITAGERANVVPSLCVATINDELALNALPQNVSVTKNNGVTVLTATGKSAHGSTPDEGINAAHAIIEALTKIFPDNDTLRFINDKVCDTSGASWNIALSDAESGKLTCNLGALRTDGDGVLTAIVDVRFPVTYNCGKMYELLRANTPAQFAIEPQHISEPLFVPSDSQLVTALMETYNSVMDVNSEPIAIGGGTYSRCLPNCVAFGPLFPNEEQTIHMPNECIDLNNLKLMAELYLEAIYKLSK